MALLEQGGHDGPVRQTWSHRKAADPAWLADEAALEREVSAYICQLPILWVAIEGEPDKAGDRARIEASVIALLSNRGREPAIDAPSAGWLGRFAASAAVRESGLWNIRHVDDPYDQAAIELLERYVTATR